MRARRMSDVEFCKNCLKLIYEVYETRRSIIITRNGVPIAKVIPAGPKPAPKPEVEKRASKKVDGQRTPGTEAGPSAPRPPDSQRQRVGKSRRTLRSGSQ